MKNIIKQSILYLLLVTTTSIITCPHDNSSVIEISTVDHHKNLLQNHQGPCVVLYHMSHCIYCQKMQPIFTKLANLFDNITFYMANGPDLQAHQDLKTIANEDIHGYPTILFLHHGNIVDRQIGAAPQNVIIQKLNNLDATTSQVKNAAKSRLAAKKNK